MAYADLGNADFHREGLWNAFEAGYFLSWALEMQPTTTGSTRPI